MASDQFAIEHFVLERELLLLKRESYGLKGLSQRLLRLKNIDIFLTRFRQLGGAGYG